VLLLLLSLAASSTAKPQESEADHYSDTARQALAAKKWSEAAQALEHLVQLAPDTAEVHANLGLAYYFEGRPGEALRSFERAHTLKPGLPQVQAMIGLCKADLGRCTEAIRILGPEFRNPSDQETGRLSGLHLIACYSQLNQPTEAVSTGDALIRRFPADAEVLYHVSRLYADRSSDLMRMLLRTAPDSAWMHYANAQVQEGLDRPDAAIQEYRNALDKDPDMRGVHYKVGRLILRESRTPEAIEKARVEFEAELAISPTNADAEYELGEIDREQNRMPAAIGHFENAVRYHPEFVEAQVGLAKVLLTMGQTAAALPHLQAAAHLEPDNKIPHYLMASAYKTLGNPEQAAVEFAIYRKLDANNSSASLQSPSPDHP
jgi:predicted Zn-dependent protease